MCTITAWQQIHFLKARESCQLERPLSNPFAGRFRVQNGSGEILIVIKQLFCKLSAPDGFANQLTPLAPPPLHHQRMACQLHPCALWLLEVSG